MPVVGDGNACSSCCAWRDGRYRRWKLPLDAGDLSRLIVAGAAPHRAPSDISGQCRNCMPAAREYGRLVGGGRHFRACLHKRDWPRSIGHARRDHSGCNWALNNVGYDPRTWLWLLLSIGMANDRAGNANTV